MGMARMGRMARTMPDTPWTVERTLSLTLSSSYSESAIQNVQKIHRYRKQRQLYGKENICIIFHQLYMEEVPRIYT